MTTPTVTTVAGPEDGRLPVADPRQSWQHMAKLLRPQRAALVLTTVLLLAGSGAALLIPLLLGRIVDAVLDNSSMNRIAAYAAVVITAGIVSALLLRTGGRLLVSCLQNALAGLREEVFAAAVRLDQDTVEEAGTSDVVSRVTGDVEAITGAVSGVLPRFVQAGFTILLTIVGLAALDPWLALAALIAVPSRRTRRSGSCAAPGPSTGDCGVRSPTEDRRSSKPSAGPTPSPPPAPRLHT